MSNTLSGALVVDVVSLLVVLVAVGRVITTDNDRYRHGRWSKAAWVLASVWIIVGHAATGSLPVGALAAIWHTHRINRVHPAPSNDVPFAEGDAEADAVVSGEEDR